MNPPSTEQALAQITDEGEFERLVTAILRDAAPQYHALLHPGINLDGKTVKSPVDGVAFVDDGSSRRMLAAHHTTTKLDALSKKWLHVPADLPKAHQSPTKQVQGDIIKTLHLFKAYKAQVTNLTGTLILTTNQEPGLALAQAAELAASTEGISLDIWPRSRLAHFLDHTAQGQWLRSKFLGIEAERLSWDLLRSLSAKSLAAHHPPDDGEAWVPRSLDRLIAAHLAKRMTFLVAQSGHGKTTAGYKALQGAIENGAAALVLTDDTIAASLTLEVAITSSLKALNPNLQNTAGSDAIRLATEARPLVILIEDINRSGRASQLVEKVAAWGLSKGKNEQKSNVCIVCPLWPGILGTLSDQSRTNISSAAVFSEGLSKEEGCAAVKQRGKRAGKVISDLDASAIANELGYDPLLIALYDHSAISRTSDPVTRYVETEIQRCALNDGQFTPADFRTALNGFCVAAMRRRTLSPKWSEIIKWQELDATARTILSRIGRAATLMHWTGTSIDQNVSYRHDRVRDRIFADAMIASILVGNQDSDTISDPYFAGILALVAADPSVPVVLIDELKTKNPLALFIAIRALKENDPRRALIVAAASEVIDMPEFQGPASNHVRWQSLSELAQTDGKDVPPLISRYREASWSTTWQARFRNGDIGGAIALCRNIEPGSGAPWRDAQIDHAKLKFGKHLTDGLARILDRTDLDVDSRIGAIRLAGHLKDQSLLDGLKKLWSAETDLHSTLADYLWAFAQCAPPNASEVLKEPCDRWAELPDKVEGKEHSSPINQLAAYNVRWAFQHWPPLNAIPYFIERAHNDSTLRWPISFMLSAIDTPATVLFSVRETAKRVRRSGSDAFFFHASNLTRDWENLQEHRGRTMSPEARDALRALWMSRREGDQVQKLAFLAWAASILPDDLAVLRRADMPIELSDQILAARLVRGDEEAIPSMVEKIKTAKYPAYWWQFSRNIWSNLLFECLERQLEARRSKNASSNSDGDYMLAEILIRLGEQEGAPMLLRHWDHLRHCNYFIHAALYFATKDTLAAAASALKTIPADEKPLEHLLMHFGIRTKGHIGVTRLEQFEGLLPYLGQLTNYDIREIWETCNELGWFEFRQMHIDQLYRDGKPTLYLDVEPTTAALDEMVARKHHYWLDHWLEKFVGTGKSASAILDLIENWARKRADLPAINLLSNAVVQLGSRSDVDRLNIQVPGCEDHVYNALKNARFAVQSRTLQ